nr:SH3 domain-containing protein [uncultured Albidiferax sp.]
MEDDKKPNFWSSLPGLLTATATVITAATGLFLAIRPSLPTEPSAPPSTQPAQVATVVPATAPVAVVAPAAASKFNLAAVIKDNDGHTNVRSKPSASSAILTRLTAGETFATYKQDGDWWQVRTADGQVGYVHISRIKILPQ